MKYKCNINVIFKQKTPKKQYKYRKTTRDNKQIFFDNFCSECYNRANLREGDSVICKTDISNLKTDILEKIGQKIIVKGSLGRSRTFEKEATLEKAYPNIFVVRYEENNRNVTYSYTDILTRTVEVDVFDGEAYSPLIPPQIEIKKKKEEVFV